MAASYKVYAPTNVTLEEVKYMVVDSYADVWLRKNIEEEEKAETIDGEISTYSVQVADEVYFQVDPNSISKSDISENFDKYWSYGEQWEDARNYTTDEIINNLKEENSVLRQCILEISALI